MKFTEDSKDSYSSNALLKFSLPAHRENKRRMKITMVIIHWALYYNAVYISKNMRDLRKCKIEFYNIIFLSQPSAYLRKIPWWYITIATTPAKPRSIYRGIMADSARNARTHSVNATRVQHAHARIRNANWVWNRLPRQRDGESRAAVTMKRRKRRRFVVNLLLAPSAGENSAIFFLTYSACRWNSRVYFN